jgi:hypothetical protein
MASRKQPRQCTHPLSKHQSGKGFGSNYSLVKSDAFGLNLESSGCCATKPQLWRENGLLSGFIWRERLSRHKFGLPKTIEGILNHTGKYILTTCTRYEGRFRLDVKGTISMVSYIQELKRTRSFDSSCCSCSMHQSIFRRGSLFCWMKMSSRQEQSYQLG